MIDKEQIIADLHLEEFSSAEQDAICDDFTLELGAAVSDGLSDEQMAEFTAIIDGDQAVIDDWLAANQPDFRNDPSYQQLEVGYREDPDKVPADKVFASMKWIETNRPDFVDIIDRVTRQFRDSLAA